MGPVQKNQSTSLQCQGTHRQNRAVRGRLQQDQGAAQLDGDGGVNPGEAPASLLANLRDRTVGEVELTYGYSIPKVASFNWSTKLGVLI
jgi:hypothetical protein